MLNTKPRCTLIIGYAIDKIFNQCTRLEVNTAQLREQSMNSEGNSPKLHIDTGASGR